MLFDWAFTDIPITPFMIAVVHSVFNLLTTVILLPFASKLEQLANRLIPNKDTNVNTVVKIDERLLTMPSMAVQRSMDAVEDMCRLSKEALFKAMHLLVEYKDSDADTIVAMKARLDEYEDHLGTYMMKLSKVGVTDADSKNIAKVLHTIDDFERIGDHAIALSAVAKEYHEKNVHFSEKAECEISKVTEAVYEIITITSKAFETSDLVLASSVEPLEQVIDNLVLKIRRNHIARIQNGTCTIELGLLLSDILTCYARVSDHCSNIAVAIIEAQHGSFDTHEYLNNIKHQGNEDFEQKYIEYCQKFSISDD